MVDDEFTGDVNTTPLVSLPASGGKNAKRNWMTDPPGVGKWFAGQAPSNAAASDAALSCSLKSVKYSFEKRNGCVVHGPKKPDAARWAKPTVCAPISATIWWSSTNPIRLNCETARASVSALQKKKKVVQISPSLGCCLERRCHQNQRRGCRHWAARRRQVQRSYY